MSARETAETTIRRLKRAVEGWGKQTPDSAGSQSEALEPGGDGFGNYSEKVSRIALAVGVNKKTIANWLNNAGDKYALTVRNLFEICEAIKIEPYTILPGCPQIETFEKIPNPVAAERALLNTEKNIPAGKCKLVAFPLWSSPLLRDKLTEVYATKGLHRRFSLDPEESQCFGERDQARDFLNLRADRRNLFEEGSYILKLLFMRDEMERWINSETLFRDCCPSDIAEQIEHIITMLKTKQWNGKPQLELRLTKSYLRQQYSICEQSRGETTIINTNSGYMKITHPDTQSFIREEFTIMWNDATYRGLRGSDKWIEFLETVKALVLKRTDSSRIELKSILTPEGDTNESGGAEDAETPLQS